MNFKRPKYGNKKVVEADGTKSDSKLESFFKRQLDANGIKYTQQVSYILMESFRYKGDLIRQVTYRLDFCISHNNKTYAVETKGFFTPDGKIKWKMFLSKYRYSFDDCLVLKNQKQINLFILDILGRINQSQ